jgi:hypothetical protein
MTDSPQQKTMTALLSDGMEQLSRLFRGEVALARAEMREALASAVSGIALMVAAMVMAITALNVLAGAVVAALTESGMGAGWSALIVGVGVAILGLIFFFVGRGMLAGVLSGKSRTAKQLQQDAQMIKETVTNDRP